MKLALAVCIFSWTLFGSCLAVAQDPKAHERDLLGIAAPLGRWKTVDDATGKVRSIVLIWESNGVLFGRIERVLDLDPHVANPSCLRCEGDLKNKPLVGLQILQNLRKNGDQWSGGEILDPDTGKIYRCSIEMLNNGKRLKVRGFIGISLFGRTQIWLRDE